MYCEYSRQFCIVIMVPSGTGANDEGGVIRLEVCSFGDGVAVSGLGKVEITGRTSRVLWGEGVMGFGTACGVTRRPRGG